MAPYIQPRWGAQLCSLLIALAVLALPLAGGDKRPSPVLIPLATRLIPLDHAWEGAVAVQAPLPDLVAATKAFLARPAAATVEPVPVGGRLEKAATVGVKGGPLDILRVRAPPAI